MDVLLVRHARHGTPAKFPQDGDLSEEGVGQAETTARVLADQRIERLFSSPYPRAIQTAAIISRGIGVPVEIRDELKNRTRVGARVPTRSEISARFPQFIIPDGMPERWCPDHPESGWEVYDRIERLATELRSLEGRHERIVVVSHAWPLDALTSVLGGCPPLERMRFYYDNCSLTLVHVTDGVGRIHYVNLVPHVNNKRELFFY